MTNIEELTRDLNNPVNAARDQGILIGAWVVILAELVLGVGYYAYDRYYDSTFAKSAISLGYANPKYISVQAEKLTDDGQGATILKYKDQEYLLRIRNDSLQFNIFQGIETITTQKPEKRSIIKYTPLN